MPRKPSDAPETLNVTPITALVPVKPRKTGRPKKLTRPPLPEFEMTDLEQSWFDYVINSYNRDYPDLLDTDQILLFLAAIQFINALRVAQDEMATGKVISMARQHPLIQMRALLDQMSVTRKARVSKAAPEDDEDRKQAKEFLMGLSS